MKREKELFLFYVYIPKTSKDLVLQSQVVYSQLSLNQTSHIQKNASIGYAFLFEFLIVYVELICLANVEIIPKEQYSQLVHWEKRISN